uniref:Formin-binding protein 1-like n=1 Tax=Paramormyrops kingsleyae TaxID=1676925 RepID=A0A3B3RHZ0_9TELE|nr:formin-binding protein 1-like [Paramormyrops kingsleyae]
MSWGTELWDQFDNLEKHTQWGIEFLEKYSKFVKERIEVEQTYGKLLRNLARKYSPKRGKDEEPRFSACLSFNTVLNELNSYAMQREVMVEEMSEKVQGELLKFSQELRSERKRHFQDVRKATQHIEQCLKLMDSSKKKFEREWKEAEKLQMNLEKLEHDCNTTKLDVDKARTQLNARLHVVEESKNEYASQLQNFNQEQRKHFTVSLPQIYQGLQDLDEKRSLTLGGSYKALAGVEQQISPIISKCLEGMVNAGNSVDVKKDSAVVVEMYKSGLEAPGDYPFEDFTQGATRPRGRTGSDCIPAVPKMDGVTSDGKQIMSKTKNKLWLFGKKPMKNSTLEDYNNLPPEQRHRKLQQRLSELKKELQKELDQRDGMVKMKDVYEKNPNLGDSTVIETSISENSATIERLQTEIARIESLLLETKGGQSSPGGTNHSSDDCHPAGSPEDTMYEDLTGGFQEFDDDEFENDDEVPTPSLSYGCVKALYPYDGKDEGSLVIHANEVLNIIEKDKGDGWTRVSNQRGKAGYVPTSYLESTGA